LQMCQHSSEKIEKEKVQGIANSQYMQTSHKAQMNPLI